MDFLTWSNKAGKAPPLTAVDPVTKVSVTFQDLEVDEELFNKSLIMLEPCPLLDRSLPIVWVIRPTKTQRAATGGDFFAFTEMLFEEVFAAPRKVRNIAG